MSFPGSIPSYTGFTSGHTLQADAHASQHNSEQADVIAIATKVGTGSSTSTNNTVLRGNGTGTSTWAQLNAATDLTGILGVGNGGTGVGTSTGSGSVVLNTSPTITTPSITSPTLTTPTIANFTNANHAHDNATDGGQLNAANSLQTGSVNFANLLSTIFSGQISNGNNGGTAGGSTHFLNLGGWKICWGQAAAITYGVGQVDASVIFPITYAATPIIFSCPSNPTSDIHTLITVNSPATTGFTITGINTTGSGSPTSSPTWLAIGT